MAATAVTERGRTTFPLLESKLCPTPPRLGTITRTALINRLRAARGAAVAVVTAPAGYGKTSLLAEWARRDDRPFAWLSLDEADDDPTVFLTYVAVALDRVHALDPEVFEALSHRRTSTKSVVAHVGRSLSSLSVPIVFVLDDVHLLRAPECVAALAMLVDQLPADSQLVLASRTATELRLGRLRAEGRVLEVGPRELSLNEREAHALLSVCGPQAAREGGRRPDAADGRMAGGALSRGSVAPCLGRRRPSRSRVSRR